MRNISDSADAVRRDARAFRERLYALSRHRSLRDPIAAACEEMQLSPPQIHALLWLGHDGALTMGDLARRISVTEKTVTGLVDRLERDRVVDRARDDADRRVVRVHLTARGAALHRRIDAEIHAKVTAFLRLLGPRDRRALFTILDRLTERLARPGREGRRA